jgi:hypothetical protein
VEGNEVVSIERNLVMHIGGRQIVHVDGGDLGRSDSPAGEQGSTEPGAPSPGSRSRSSSAISDGQANLPDPATEALWRAQLLWLSELVPAEHSSRARDLVNSVLGMMDAAKALDAAPRGERQNQIEAMVTRSAACLEQATAPVPPALGRLQSLAVIRMQALSSSLAKVGGDGQGGGGGRVPSGRGEERGGGGGAPPRWSEKDKESILAIKGGGRIESLDGLTLAGQGGTITIKGGEMKLEATANVTISAPRITLTGGVIEIVGGETIVKGAPIRLN